MAAPQTDPQYKLRFPEELRDLIAEAARANNRSMNAEIVSRLQSTFDNKPTMLLSADMRPDLFAKEVARNLADIMITKVPHHGAPGQSSSRTSLLSRLANAGFLRGGGDNEAGIPTAPTYSDIKDIAKMYGAIISKHSVPTDDRIERDARSLLGDGATAVEIDCFIALAIAEAIRLSTVEAEVKPADDQPLRKRA